MGIDNTAPPTRHRFYTRAKARVMVDENAARFEQMVSLTEIVLRMTKRKVTI